MAAVPGSPGRAITLASASLPVAALIISHIQSTCSCGEGKVGCARERCNGCAHMRWLASGGSSGSTRRQQGNGGSAAPNKLNQQTMLTGQELEDEEAEERGEVDGAQQRRHQAREQLEVGVGDLWSRDREGRQAG